MLDVLRMIGSGLIAGGLTSCLLGVLAAMTWGRLMDRFERIEKHQSECSDHFEKCVTDLYNKTATHGERIAKIEG